MDDLLLISRGRLRSRPPQPAWADAIQGSFKPRALDVFARTLSRQYKSASSLFLSWKNGLSVEEREREKLRDDRRSILHHHMKTAPSLKQWYAAAQELDALEGNDNWKRDLATGDYNPRLIEQRLHALDDARLRCDIRSIMHLVRTTLSRDLGGMGNVDLYRHSYVGTKQLIERYVESAIQTIDAIVVQSVLDPGVDSKDLLEGMLFSRQSFGRSALLLSGGGTFGMTHIGVLKALFEARLLPRILSGASAGSIVAAVVCTRPDEEIPDLLDQFPYGDLAVFESTDNYMGLLDHVRRLLTEGSWSDIQNLTRVMRRFTGDLTFQEAYNRTRRILNICVSTASIYELPRLLNYVTAPNVLIWSAVAASCSVPLFFNSSPLLVKDPVSGEHHPWNPTTHRFIDGSVDNDLPMTRLAEMFNVNHFIVSQVNPHVVPFLSKEDHHFPHVGATGRVGRSAEEFDWTQTLASLAREEALHRLQFMADMGVFPNLMTKCRSILSQRYSGDITILPEITMHDLPRLMSNPTSEFMLRSSVLGERATWPKLSRIRDQCAIELALDRAVHRLRTRVVFSTSQRKLGSSTEKTRNRMPPFMSGQPPLGDPVGNGLGPRRQRRRSGGSLQTTSNCIMILDDGSSDDNGGQNESTRPRIGCSASAPGKPRLKRASRSQIHVPQTRMPLIASRPHHVTDDHLYRPFALVPGRDLRSAGREAADELKAWAHETESPRGMTTSPTEEAESSEQGQSSDADVEQATEESDPDSLDSHGKHGGEKRASQPTILAHDGC